MATRKKIVALRTYMRSVGNSAPRTKKIMQTKGEAGLWQRRFWEHTIRDDCDFKLHCDYIHYNPVRYGYVSFAGAVGFFEF